LKHRSVLMGFVSVLIIGLTIASVLIAGNQLIYTKARDANGILFLKDVTSTLTAGGFSLARKAGITSYGLDINGTSPQVFRILNSNDTLYIYIFKSIGEREKIIDIGSNDKPLAIFAPISRLSFFFPARNTLIVYVSESMPILNSASDLRLKSLNNIVFTGLNDGKVLVFKGEGAYWKASVVYKYYEYWWQDSGGRMQYESWHSAQPALTYKGADLKDIAPINYRYTFKAPSGSFGGSQDTGFDGSSVGAAGVSYGSGLAAAGLGSFSGNGALTRADETYQATIDWNGERESFSLKAES